MAILAEENNDLENAEAYYVKALKVSDDWWGTYYHYGTFCWRQERYEEAAVWLKKARQFNPTYFQIFQNLGLVLIELGKYTEAQDTLMQLLQVAPDNMVRRQTLQLLDRLNKPEIETETHIRKLEELWESGEHWHVIKTLFLKYHQAKSHWYYWYLLGNVMKDFNQNALVLVFWQIGLKHNPGYPLFKQLGLFYWSKGNYRKALPILRKAYQLHQGDEEIAKAYLQTLVNLGEVEELQNNARKLSQLVEVK